MSDSPGAIREERSSKNEELTLIEPPCTLGAMDYMDQAAVAALAIFALTCIALTGLHLGHHFAAATALSGIPKVVRRITRAAQ